MDVAAGFQSGNLEVDLASARARQPTAWRRVRDDAARATRAIHEAGHAVYATVALGAASVERVSLGANAESATTTLTAAWVLASMAASNFIESMLGMAYAGLVAEELLLGEQAPSANCEDDLDRAVRLALHRQTDEAYVRLFLDPDEGIELSPRASDAIEAELRAGHARALATVGPRQAAVTAVAEALLASTRGELVGEDLRTVLEDCLGLPLA